MTDCLFCKIIKKEIAADIVYEDEDNLAFMDIFPVNKGHVLVVPKKHSANILDIDKEDLKKLIVASQKVAKAVLLGTKAEGVNVSMNNNRASGQVVFHTHFHIIPRFMNDGHKPWAQGKYAEGEQKKFAEAIRKKLQ